MTTTNTINAGAVHNVRLAIKVFTDTMGRSKARSAALEAVASLEQFALSLQVVAFKGQTDYNLSVAHSWLQDSLNDLKDALLVNRDAGLQGLLLDAYVTVAGIDVE